MRYDYALLIIGKRRSTLGSVTMSRDYAWWLAGHENDKSIMGGGSNLYRAVPLPLTGDVSAPTFVEMTR